MDIDPSDKQQNDFFEIVFNAINEGVTIIDKDLKIRFQNRVITQLYGSSLIDQHCYKAYRGRKEPCEDCQIGDCMTF